MAVAEPVGPLMGVQVPRLESHPPFFTSLGEDAADLAASAGLRLDPWQKHVLSVGLGIKGGDRWANYEVCFIVPRQNGKGGVLEARVLAGLFLLGEERILHTAHEYKTANDAFKRMRVLIRRSPHLMAQVHPKSGIRIGNVDPGITLINGCELSYVARTGGSGRGLPAKCLILDEAFNYPDHVQAALSPTLTAADDPQIWYTSSAVNQATQPHGLNLARVRRRGLRGDDPDLAFFEWSIDEDEFRADPKGVASDAEVMRVANPAMGIRITEEFLRKQLRSMGPTKFAVEHLAVGDWPPEPPDEGGGVVDAEVWGELADRLWEPSELRMFGLEVNPSRSAASVAVAALDGDGVPHGEVVDNRDGTGWVVERCAELVRKYGGAVVLDPSAPAGSLLPDLERAGVPVVKVSAREFAQACGAFLVAVDERTVRHSNQLGLNTALDSAVLRGVGDAQAWDRKGTSGDLSPLVAFTLALFGLSQARSAVPAIF